MSDWNFARRPRWILSHLFALSLIVGFLSAGFWQLDRLDQRRTANQLIENRALVAAQPLATVLAGAADDDPDGLALDYVRVEVTGRFVDGEVVRVANRTQDGRGGDWVVGTFRTADGRLLLVNRGFLLRQETTAPAPEGEVEIAGWLRRTRTKGLLGADDAGVELRIPRLNVADVEARIGDDLVPWWLQLDTIDGVDPAEANAVLAGAADEAVTPRPIELDSLDEGNHFSYAVQWFIFATLSIVIYGLLLRRLARVARPGSPDETESGEITETVDAALPD